MKRSPKRRRISLGYLTLLSDVRRQRLSANDRSIWVQLSRCGIFSPAVIDTLRAQFRNALQNRADPASLDSLAWLQSGGLVSEFHAKLLRGGFAGPFSFGEYLIIDRRPNVAGLATFAARHVPTKHNVQLSFVPGSCDADGERWKDVERKAKFFRAIRQPTLLRVHETVELAEYRFVVLEASAGIPLEDRLGHRGRLPWPAACGVVAHVASAIELLHALTLVHGNVNSREVFLEPNGFPRLSPPISPSRSTAESGADEPRPDSSMDSYRRPDAVEGTASTAADDIYAIVVLLFRAIRGETPSECLAARPRSEQDPSAAIGKLAKYDLPAELVDLLRQGLESRGGDPPFKLPEFSDRLDRLAQGSGGTKLEPTRTPPTAAAYVKWLEKWRLGVPEIKPAPAPSSANALSIPSADRPTEFADFAAPLTSAGPARRRHRSVRTNAVIWIVSAAAMIASLVTIYQWNRASNSTLAIAPSPTNLPAVKENPPAIEASPPERPIDSGAADREKPSGNWIEKIVEDNGEALWQSPTNGAALDFELIPPGASVLVVVRPNDLAHQAETSRVIKALGAEFQSYVGELLASISVPGESIEQLVIALYPNDQRVLEPFYRVRLVAPLRRGELTDRWEGTGFAADPSLPGIWFLENLAFGFQPSAAATSDSSNTDSPDAMASEFVFGSREHVAAALVANESNPLTGPMAQLVNRTDQDRHVTVLGSKAGLFSELGRSVLPERYRVLQQRASQLIEEQVRAILFSAHWDEGFYAELVFDETVDLKASVLRDAATGKWKAARDEMSSYIGSLPRVPYWEHVQQRFGAMLADVSRHLRIDDEFNQVLLNLWLPPMAAHNLIATTDLALSTQPVDDAAIASNRNSTPATMGELLQVRRTLQNSNPPDLNILIDSLQAEIKDDFPTLPFAFEIRLSNVDLREGGITRNQRLARLDIVDQTLEQVLTQICFQANPDKNATGPEDPKCALVWVLTRDNESKADVILITTRAAAAKNNWPLPESFQPGPR